MHPWFGDTVTVVRGYGPDAAWIEREDGERRIIPIAWTSLQPRLTFELPNGEGVRLSPVAALELARLVRARLRER